MPVTPEPDLERLRDAVALRLGLARSPFIDNLADRGIKRYPAMMALEEPAPEAGATELPVEPTPPVEVPIDRLEGGLDGVAAFIVEQLRPSVESEVFPFVLRVAVHQDGQAFEQLMKLLDSLIKVKGILYRHGLDPDAEFPGLWGRVWEAIPKWDGRDFRAYMARIIRNHCLDEIGRKKRAPSSIGDDDPRDPRALRSHSTVKAVSQDALAFVQDVLGELESSGRIKAVDAVIFGVVGHGRAVADILDIFARSPVLPRLVACLEVLGVGKRLPAGEATVLRLVADGLTPDEVARVTGRDPGLVREVASALGALEVEDDRMLAQLFAREGISAADVKRARGLNANALNLILNRIRLKLWMACCDRAYEALRRRDRIDAIDLAIVQHRCDQPSPTGCRMYKDRACKREVDAATIARKAGLDCSPAIVDRRMTELRTRLVEEGLGQVFPDYNACLTERKPDRDAPRSGR